MSDPISAYQNALAAFHDAKAKVSKIVGQIEAGQLAVKNEAWRMLVIHNAGFQFPEHVVKSSHNKIDANDWPSIEQVAAALIEFHATMQAAKDRWDEIPNKTGISLPYEIGST